LCYSSYINLEEAVYIDPTTAQLSQKLLWQVDRNHNQNLQLLLHTAFPLLPPSILRKRRRIQPGFLRYLPLATGVRSKFGNRSEISGGVRGNWDRFLVNFYQRDRGPMRRDQAHRVVCRCICFVLSYSLLKCILLSKVPNFHSISKMRELYNYLIIALLQIWSMVMVSKKKESQVVVEPVLRSCIQVT